MRLVDFKTGLQYDSEKLKELTLEERITRLEDLAVSQLTFDLHKCDPNPIAWSQLDGSEVSLIFAAAGAATKPSEDPGPPKVVDLGEAGNLEVAPANAVEPFDPNSGVQPGQ